MSWDKAHEHYCWMCGKWRGCNNKKCDKMSSALCRKHGAHKQTKRKAKR